MTEPGEREPGGNSAEPKRSGSLKSDMAAHPERYPGGTWREPQPGRTRLVFLGRKPTKAPKKQS